MMIDVSFFLLGLNVNGLVSSPSGLPPGAIAYADFKAGTYYYGGNALSDFLVQNLDYWGIAFSPDAAVPGSGIVVSDSLQGPVLGPALATQIIGAEGCTFVISFTPTGPTQADGAVFEAAFAQNPQGTQYIYTRLQTLEVGTVSRLGDFNDYNSPSPENLTWGVSYRAAVTLSSTHLALSINGGSVVTYEVTDPFVCNMMGFKLLQIIWENVIFYPVKADADLLALSAV